MTYVDAIKYMQDGRHVSRRAWTKDNKDGCGGRADCMPDTYFYVGCNDDRDADDWYVVDEVY